MNDGMYQNRFEADALLLTVPYGLRVTYIAHVIRDLTRAAPSGGIALTKWSGIWFERNPI